MKQFIELEGRRLAYLDEGNGPVIVFGHSYLWDSAMWAPQVNALKEHYRCIVPELWGHGDSDGLPAGHLTLETLARQHLDLLDALGIDQFVLVGLSIGGMWGIELSQLAGSRLKGLVLMDTFVGLEPQITCERYLGMLGAIEAARQVPEAIARQVAPLFFRQQPDEAMLSSFIERLTHWPAEKIDALVAVGRSFVTRADRMEWLETLTCPAQVITGCEDRARPVLEGYLMADTLGIALIEIAGAGHISTLEQPERVNAALTEFLRRSGW